MGEGSRGVPASAIRASDKKTLMYIAQKAGVLKIVLLARNDSSVNLRRLWPDD